MNAHPRFAAALSTNADSGQAVAEVCQQASAALDAAADLALVFVSHHHGPDFGPLAAAISAATGVRHLLGCTGESIVGTGREVEGQPAISLWLGHLPGVSIAPMRLEFTQTAEGGTLVGWPEAMRGEWPAGSVLMVLGEPFSFPSDVLLERLNEDRPGVPVVGGMASGGWNPGQNRLLYGREEFDRGAVAVLLHGAVAVQSVVSQGCRPIGRPYVITKAQRNVILELSGKPPLVQLKEVLETLSEREREQLQRGLHVGRVINEYQEQFSRGDFLVRNVVGIDPKVGAIAIGDYVRPGQTVQFHIRDAQSADEDLRELLAHRRFAPQAALLFTCNGRGTRLFSEPHHDAGVLQQSFGDIPVAGFFAQGELGPIGGKNFVHGFTASTVLFGERTDG